ncbi:MAG: phosphoenolpyruvate carboxykinase (ATP) [Candidatus Promineifilaceae bacterium]
MQDFGPYPSKHGLEQHGIANANTVYWHLTTPMLYEQAVRRREGEILHHGPIAVRTGDHTGRSPNDKFIVEEPGSQADIWWGPVNRPISQVNFNHIQRRLFAYVQNRDVFVFDGYVGADPRFRLNVRVISELAWHNLFARNMFIRELDAQRLTQFEPDFTVINMALFRADPEQDHTSSPTFILMDFGKRLVLIGGSAYSGEIKKSIFTAMNYYLPRRGVMPMHCSANYGRERDEVALFFGLSGTGKTTLSNDPGRTLIGDDEHGWSDDGVFNFEGGCYAKVIRLDPMGEPEIYEATRRFGTILENVAYDPDSRRPDLSDDSLTENTRGSYPISHIANADPTGIGGHPKNVILLTADAFGAMPPISRLTTEQAMYHFLSGYTAKVAGTERGVTEPKATFSACFGAPFMPQHPGVYTHMLGEKLGRHKVNAWLINTGWTGGAYGQGSRMQLSYTRRMVAAVLGGELDRVESFADPVFGLRIPAHVEGVPDEVLRPRDTWPDGEAYDAQATKLAYMFRRNFEQFAADVSPDVAAAGPEPGGK